MMLPKYWVSLAFIGWALSSPCFANAPTLRPLIEKTLETHSDILAIQAQKNAFLKLADQSQIGSNPEIELGVGQKRDSVTSGLTFETTLKQTLLYPGKSDSKKTLALSEVGIKDSELDGVKARLVFDIEVNAYRWQYSIQKRDINQKRIQKLSWMKDYLASRPFASPQKKLELRLIESHVKNNALDGIQLGAQVEANRVQLKTLIAEHVTETIRLPIVPFDLKKITARHSDLVLQNPEIRAIDAKIKQIDLETRVLEIDANPNFDISGRYASESASGTDQFLSIGFGMELPLSNKNRMALVAQTHKKEALEQQRTQLIKEKKSQWQAAVIAINRSEEILQIYTPAWVTQLETSLDHAINGFKKGQTDLLMVLELESQWIAASDTQTDAKLEWVTAVCTLHQLLGDTQPIGAYQQ